MAIGLAFGYLRAHARNTPLARPGEFFKYIKTLYKPAFWGFVSMFIIVLVFGAIVNDNYLKVLQKAIVAGLYISAVVFVSMVGAVNILRQEK